MLSIRLMILTHFSSGSFMRVIATGDLFSLLILQQKWMLTKKEIGVNVDEHCTIQDDTYCLDGTSWRQNALWEVCLDSLQ